tara:strand:- start:69 stop:320 length:252 start_codon:yes stop_codon:yes gene_type:complete
MSKFAIIDYLWFNKLMKNTGINIREKMISKYLDKETSKDQKKSTDINILLNRIEVNKKNESRKKLYFSAAASTGIVLFGLIIF